MLVPPVIDCAVDPSKVTVCVPGVKVPSLVQLPLTVISPVNSNVAPKAIGRLLEVDLILLVEQWSLVEVQLKPLA